MMTSSSVHNELVTIVLSTDASINDEESGTHNSLGLDLYNSRHGLNDDDEPPVREYRYETKISIFRRIQGYMRVKPRIFTFLLTWLLCAFPLLIVVIILAAKSYSTSNDNIQLTKSINDDVWNTFQVTSLTGAVSADHPVCSKVGVDILNKGGNAVDAIIAAKLCLGIVSPASSGIGGGGYLLIHNGTNSKNVFIDCRETAPKNATPAMFENNPIAAQDGGLAIAVPGEIKGLYLAWERFGSGSLSWAEVVSPAAILAEKWSITEEVAYYINYIKPQLLSGKYPELASYYVDRFTGKIKSVGEFVYQPKLAAFLRRLAEIGPDAFYKEKAHVLAQEIQAAGGIVTAEDIMNYELLVYEEEDLIHSTFYGYNYVSVGGSSSGGASVAGILNFIESYPETIVSTGDLYWHRLAEAFKHVFAMRTSLGDPEYVNTTAAIEALLSKEFMSNLQHNTLDDNVLDINQYGGIFNITRAVVDDHGTTHLNSIDKWGNAVAMTSTINTYFGSKVASPSTGILFNNEMDDFSIPGSSNFFNLAPSPFNYPEPYKRPLSSMSPSFLFDKNGKLRMIGGASGGPIIITATAQVILNFIGKGWSLLNSVKNPRIHTQLLPNIVYYEYNTHLIYPSLSDQTIELPEKAVESLQERHHLLNKTTTVAITQWITVDPDTGLITAVSDPRKGGIPAGQ